MNPRLGFAAVLLPAPGGSSAEFEGIRLSGQLHPGEAPLLWRRAGLLRLEPFAGSRRWRDPGCCENGRSGYAAALWNDAARDPRVWRAGERLERRRVLGACVKRA